MTKRCYKCKEEKVAEAFSKNQSCCKPCKKSYRLANISQEKLRKQAYQKANKERLSLRKRLYYAANKSKILAKQKARYEANKGKIAETQRIYYESNREAILKRNKLYQQKDVAKASARKSKKAYKQANPEKVTAMTAKRRSQKMQATPKWMAKTDFAAIEEWYKLAKELRWLSEEPLHVDHIVPLQGKDVCGLHVPWNLQILPASENIRKGNKVADHVVKYESTVLATEATGGGL